MSGNKMGSIKRKLGLRGATKPGQMISRMNAMKSKHKFDPLGMAQNAAGSIKSFFNSKPHVPSPVANAVPGGGMFAQHNRNLQEALSYKKTSMKKCKKYGKK